jgi:hypothetical protein
LEEPPGQFLEAGKFTRSVTALSDKMQRRSALFKQGKIALSAANVSSENHSALSAATNLSASRLGGRELTTDFNLIS